MKTDDIEIVWNGIKPFLPQTIGGFCWLILGWIGLVSFCMGLMLEYDDDDDNFWRRFIFLSVWYFLMVLLFSEPTFQIFREYINPFFDRRLF